MELKVPRVTNTIIGLIKSIGKADLKFVEIGVHVAKSANLILQSCGSLISEYVGIDPYMADGHYSRTEKAGTGKYINVLIRMREYPQFRLIREKSNFAVQIFPDNHFDFIYIDGNHEYEYVRSDITLYLPKLKTTGILAGHDYSRTSKKPGVIKAVHEIFGEDCERGSGTLFIVRFKDGKIVYGDKR